MENEAQNLTCNAGSGRFDAIERLPKWLIAPAKMLNEFFAALTPARYSLIFTAAGILAFTVVPQGRDVLRILVEKDHFLIGVTITFGAVLLWSLSVWYWARTVLSLKRWQTSPGLRAWWPRVLGTGCWLGWALAQFLAARAYTFKSDTPFSPVVRLWLLTLISVVAAGAFLVFVTTRRAIVGRLTSLSRKSRFKTLGKIGEALALGKVDDQVETLAGWRRWMIVGNFLLSAVLLILFTAWPVQIAWKVGTAAIVLLTFAIWTFYGTSTVILGKAYGIPIVSLGLLVAFVFSFRNDNHAIRTLCKIEDRPTLEEKIGQWATPDTLNGDDPIFIVAAEGGGIRAAYWTARVLGVLQEQSKGEFSRHLFAISGVSGGSVGAGVFAALVSDAAVPEAKEVSFVEDAAAILGQDFLSPIVGMALAPDALQRLLPVPFSVLDRSRGLEESWEAAWHQQRNNDRLAEGFLTLRRNRDRSGSTVPSLFFNSTHVGTGKRWIASDLAFRGNGTGALLDAEDFLARLGKDIPLSTAMHNSARFTYISPAGSFYDQCDDKHRLVDGGYFENFGATTARQLIEALVAHGVSPTRIRVLAITNGELDSDEEESRTSNELLAPIKALLNTRSARGSLSLEELCELAESFGRDAQAPHTRGAGRCTVRQARETPAEDRRFFRFALCARDKSSNKRLPLPLGWGLSSIAQDAMNGQLYIPPEKGGESRPEESSAPCELQEDNFDNAATIQKMLRDETQTSAIGTYGHRSAAN